jgi:UDP-N-acetylglucosamine--N-acetylmuramyl-(pentapeptide) pyrophosphoryl-undecaprenol N-acetylglucosamine transferase
MMKTTARLQILFSGGGTAGHLIPGLAVAAELAALADRPRIVFAGSGKTFEKRMVNKAGFEYVPLRCSPMARGIRGMWRFVGENVAGYREARQFLREEKIDAVVGLGGYASVPCSRAAIKHGVPLVVLEQNAIPGKATRWLAPHADLLCTAMEETGKHLRSVVPVCVTGNPIRAAFQRRMKPIDLRGSTRGGWRHRLLVLGGSGGARSLNECMPEALDKLRHQLNRWQIVHQTGGKDLATTRDLYCTLNIPAIVVPFVENMPSVMRRTDVAVCRAGGSTLSELAATGVPAILVPYPRAADDHQLRNAEAFVAAGAARMVDERDVAVQLEDSLAAELHDLLVDSSRRRAMSLAMLQQARPDAAWQVAMMVFELARQAAGRKVA